MGWPLRKRAKYGEFGGSFIYPMGDDLVSLGFVAGLEYRDVEFSVHDVLQEFKTHKLVRKILARRRAGRLGREDDHRGRLPRAADAVPRAGAAARRRGRRARQRADAEGHPLRDRVRDHSRPRPRSAALQRGESPTRLGALDSYDEELRVELRRRRTSTRCGTCARSSTRASSSAARCATAMTVTKGKLPPKDFHSEPNAAHSLIRTGRAPALPGAGRQAHLRQALLGLPLRQPDARRPAEPHPDPAARCRSDLAEPGCTCARRRCTSSAAADGDGLVHVDVNPSNCVQCGAITAKGGRLTPPEGGSGPEYTLT